MFSNEAARHALRREGVTESRLSQAASGHFEVRAQAPVVSAVVPRRATKP